MALLVGTSINGPHACYVGYWPTSNTISLLDDLGQNWLSLLQPGQPDTLSNSQCSLYVGNSFVTHPDNSSVALHAALTFTTSGQPPFSGLQYLYQDTVDVYSQWSNWQMMGIWTPDPWNVSVSPASGSASAGTFSATSYSDAGYQNLIWIGLMINTSSSVSANSCYVGYWPANGSSQDLLLGSGVKTRFQN
jgi:hypothetical protein